MNSSDSNQNMYDYATFPRQFLSYRWFKPILVALLTVVFMTIFQIILMLIGTIWSGDPNFLNSIGGSYETMDAYTGPGALVELGALAVILPALALAALIVRDRPYSSYSSSRGGWNWGGFAKCLGVAVAVVTVFTLVQVLLFPDETGAANAEPQALFTTVGFVVCMVLVPFQCLAEEYLFRGLLFQAVSSWTKLPVVGILVSAAVFAAGHPYNGIGVVTIFLNGVIWAFLVWRTRGLEASSAMHIVNNLLSFGLTGFGLAPMTSEIDMASLVYDVATCVAFAAIVLVADKKFGWFKPKGDGTAKHNDRVRQRLARKQAHSGMPAGQPMPPAYPGQPMQAMQPGYPAQGAYPAQPGYPAQGAYPAQPGYSAQAMQPGQPTQPGYPAQAMQPGQLAQPGYSMQPDCQAQPNQVTTQTAQPGYPAQDIYPAQPGYPAQGAPTTHQGQSDQVAAQAAQSLQPDQPTQAMPAAQPLQPDQPTQAMSAAQPIDSLTADRQSYR